jgi:hypothetical protein
MFYPSATITQPAKLSIHYLPTLESKAWSHKQLIMEREGSPLTSLSSSEASSSDLANGTVQDE